MSLELLFILFYWDNLISITIMYYFHIQGKNTVKNIPNLGEKKMSGRIFSVLVTRDRSAHVSRCARLSRALISVAPVSCFLSLPTDYAAHLPLAGPPPSSRYRPGLHCLLIQTTWDPYRGVPVAVSRQKREPQPSSGCQRLAGRGISTRAVPWETASSQRRDIWK